VERWLADEIRRLSATTDRIEPSGGDDGEAARSLPELFVEVEAGRLPAKAVVLLYRQEVLGESLDELAAEAGVTVDALRMRRNRAVDQIRTRLAE
jgi:DNA-directed RNA polymerase specialized sigma24 family protein